MCFRCRHGGMKKGFGVILSLYCLGSQEKKMRIMQPATIVLMALLVAMTVACATPRKQPNSYEECISLCSD